MFQRCSRHIDTPATGFRPPMIAPGILLALATQAPPYWQQRLEYAISARLDEPSGVLSGTERIVYHNNSPDTLRTFALHLYLNAFRPGSRWADADSAEGRRRFNDLRDPDFGFNRVSDVTVGGVRVEALYPFAPDSTIVRFVLPNPVAPGQTFTAELGWAARPSTLPRRQGRRGRAYDFAQWYPRVVAYDRYGWEEHPLYPGGEFYGDFGDFRVVLDVQEDQVVGATGVPVCGDPGWERANRNPGRPVEYQRDAYGPPQCLEGRAEPGAGGGGGRKQIVWEARDVHHFAMSMNPGYRYEGGRYGNVAVHVLYRAGDDTTWGRGVAVRNTETALRWLDQLFGQYAWPQITNVHRIESGGTEFPMMVHDGSAGLGLILHEVGHNYLMGILANNEWKEGFLDEGFTSFQTTWYYEVNEGRGPSAYRQPERSILLSDLDGWSEPTSLVSDRYRDFGSYNNMIYNRGELFYHQLRTIVGDSVMRAIFRSYYQRWKLKHVDETAFRETAEEVSHRDLKAFFGQWLHTTALYDYAVGKVRAVRTDGRADGGTGDRWRTGVEVVRKSPGVFPVDVVVRTPTDSAMVRADGIAQREWVELSTRDRPREVELDPETRSHDWNALNNRKRRGLFGFKPAPRHELYLDRFFAQPTRRDRVTLGFAPTVWYNAEGGVTLGVRARSDYLGRFEQNVLHYTFDTRGPDEFGDRSRIGVFARLENPTWLYQPRTSETFEGYRIEGRAGLTASVEKEKLSHRGFGPQTFFGAGARWLVTTDTGYLDEALWDGGGTVEGTAWIRSRNRWGRWNVAGRLSVGGGIEYRNRGPGVATEDSYDAQPYFRAGGEFTGKRTLGRSGGLAVRLFGGVIEAARTPLKQRQFFAAGADPYEQFSNAFLRSRGALLVRSGVHYHQPGGGNLRGLDPGVSSTRLLAINVEVDRAVLSRSRARLFNQVRVAAFGDAALGNGDLPRDGRGAALPADLGIGVRIGHRIGDTFFVTRFDFPLVVSRLRLAVSEGEGAVRFRWVFSFAPAI